MLNSVSSIQTSTPQMTFKRKGSQRLDLHKFIDATSGLATEVLNKDQPLAEQRKAAIRKSLSLLSQKMKDSYIGKIVERGKGPIEHMGKTYRKSKENDAYVKWIIGEVKAGRIDADHATALIANYGILDRLVFKLLGINKAV